MIRRFLLPISVLLGVAACGETSTPADVYTRSLLQTRTSPSASMTETSPLGNAGVLNVAVSDAEILNVIAALVQQLGTVDKAPVLSEGAGAALRNHLGNAASHIQDQRYDLALPPLRVFHAQVSHFVTKGTLTSAQGQPLLDGVAWIFTELLDRFACPAPTDIEAMLQESLEDQEARPWIRMDIRVAEDAVVIDQPVTLLVILRNDRQPLVGSDVRVSIGAPAGGYCVTLQLLDDGAGADETPGDGVYTTVFTPTQPGSYRLFVAAEGAATNNLPFVRARTLSLFVPAALPDGARADEDEGPPMVIENPVPPVLFNPPVLPGPGL